MPQTTDTLTVASSINASPASTVTTSSVIHPMEIATVTRRMTIRDDRCWIFHPLFRKDNALLRVRADDNNGPISP
jgi:hypothetical protein